MRAHGVVGPGALRSWRAGGPANSATDPSVTLAPSPTLTGVRSATRGTPMPTPTLRERLCGDEGAGSVEYIGAILVVVAIIGSIAVSATPVGNTIMARICEAFGAECGADVVVTEPPAQPDHPCTLGSETGSLTAGVSIAFIDVDAGGQMIVDRMSDDTYRVVLNGDLGVAAVASAGEAHGALTINGYGGALELSADASVGVLGSGGAEFTFPDQASAEAYTDWVQRNLIRSGVANATGPMGAPVVGLVGSLWDLAMGYDYTPPAPTAIYGEAGITGGLGAGAGGAVAGGSASIDLVNVLGAKYDMATGAKTVYTRVELSAEAAAQVGFSTSDANWGQGASGSGNVEIVMGMTLDADGTMTGVAVEGAATAEGSYALTDLAGYPLQDGGGRGVQLSAQFPVTDANREQVTSALAGLGVLAASTGSPAPAQGAALPMILAEAQHSGTITAQTLDVSSSELLGAALALKAPAVGGLGVRLGATTSTQDTIGAYYLDELGWKDWTNCFE